MPLEKPGTLSLEEAGSSWFLGISTTRVLLKIDSKNSYQVEEVPMKRFSIQSAIEDIIMEVPLKIL